MIPWRQIGRSFALVAACVTWACGGHGHSTDDAPEPIAECAEYEQGVSACTGRKMPIGAQIAAVTQTSPNDRERLRALCITNLAKIKDACR
jgi:hypothetical protein